MPNQNSWVKSAIEVKERQVEWEQTEWGKEMSGGSAMTGRDNDKKDPMYIYLEARIIDIK